MTVKQTWIDRFHNWMKLKNYAARTIKCYDCSLRQFWDYCEKRKHDPDFSKVRAVEIYLLERMDAGRKWQTINGDYSALRLGEALRLRIEDIDAGSMQIRVLDGKGKKDRFTILSLMKYNHTYD